MLFNSYNYYMNIAKDISEQSDHPFNKKVGCILVEKDEILSSGYNKIILNNYKQEDILEREKRTHLMCHAEEMCLLKLNNNTNNIKITNNTHIFITSVPCSTCTRLIILSGIKNVVYPENSIIGSHWIESCDFNEIMFKDSDINVIKVSGIYKHSGRGHCINCNIYMNNNIDRQQLCKAVYCGNKDTWFCHDENKKNISVVYSNIKKRKLL